MALLRLVLHRRGDLERKHASVKVISAQPQADAKKTSASILPVLAAAFAAAAIMYPVDLVRALQMANTGSGKTTMQMLSQFRQQHGLAGFFTQGLAPELCRSTWMRFVKFSLFPIVHMSMHGIPESAGNAAQKALAAILASIPEAVSIMPLEIAKISLQLDATNRFKNNMFKSMASVWKEKGLKGMSTGYLGVQYRQSMWSVGYFASVKYFEKSVNECMVSLGIEKSKASDTASQLLSGFLAGVFGALINTPGDTLRTVLQKRVLSNAAGSAEATLLSVGREIVAARGVGALYAGISFKALHLGGGGALMAYLIPFFRTKVLAAQRKAQMIEASAAAKLKIVASTT